MSASASQLRVLGALTFLVALVVAMVAWTGGEDTSLPSVQREVEQRDVEVAVNDTSLFAAAPSDRRETRQDVTKLPTAAAASSADDEVPSEDEVWEPAPEDPKESGVCALRITLLESESYKPIASMVSLYRLDAPANEFHGRGDQMQVEAHVPNEGLLLTDLPEGEYRAIVHAQARTQPAPPSFYVSGVLTEQTLSIQEPKSATAWLEVYTADGRRLEKARLLPMGGEMSLEGRTLPTWIRPRPCKRNAVYSEALMSIRGGFGSSSSETLLSAGGKGFPLRGVREADYRSRLIHDLNVGFENRSSVRVRIDPMQTDLHDERQMKFVAVAGDLEDLLPRILLPKGRDGRDIASDVRAVCQARLTQVVGSEPWLDLAVDVSVNSEGFEPLEFSWIPARGPAEIHVLTPKP